MTKTMELIKINLIEGANLAEIEEAVLKDSIAGLTKERLADMFAKPARHSIFESIKDSLVSKGVESYKENFEKDGKPLLEKEIRDRLEKELNPDLTPQDKRLKELEDKLAEKDKAEQTSSLKALLRRKAKELDYDQSKAERFAMYGDEKQALTALELDAGEFKEAVKLRVEELTKSQFTKSPPRGGDPVEAEALTVKYAEAQKAGNVKAMMAIKEQQSKKP